MPGPSIANSAQKTPFVSTQTRFAEERIGSAWQLLTKAPPASIVSMDSTNTIATVALEIDSIYTFPPITCPVFGPQFIRYPLGKGVKGVLLSGDYYLGGVSGLGDGRATLGKVANLSSCVFFPIGNASFSPVEDKEKTIVYGNDGVILRDKDNKISFTIDANRGLQVIWNGTPLMTFSADGISLQYNGHGVVINNSGTFIDGVQFLPHQHTNVQTGTSTTGPVNT